MARPNEISELPAVIDGLEVRIDASLRRWMMRVKPLAQWESSGSGRGNDHPQPWWPAFCDLAERAFRDGVNHKSATSLKSQVLAATKSTQVTLTLLSKSCRLTTQGYADAFADPPAQSLAPGNLARAYLAERGISVVEPRFEELRDAGVGFVMRMIRYSFLPDDTWYSVYLRDPALAAKLSDDRANKGVARGPRKYAFPDWKNTWTPHRAIAHALRSLILRNVELSPDCRISLPVARITVNAVKALTPDHADAPPWGESPELLIDALRPWITPFMLTVYALDPQGLAEAVKQHDEARRHSNV